MHCLSALPTNSLEPTEYIRKANILNPKPLYIKRVTEVEVANIIVNLLITKSKDCYDIILLKKSRYSFIVPLTYIIKST